MSTIDNNKSFNLWPYAIVVGLALFMSYIAWFVYQAMQEEVNLVSKDYYEQEIAYQDHINTVGRTKSIGDVAISYKEADQSILLQLPDEYKGQKLTGVIHLFRPSDSKLDQQVPLQPGRDLSQLVDAGKLEKGIWKVRVSFNAGDQKYYTEETIQLK